MTELTKEEFVKLYEEANGDRAKFNTLVDRAGKNVVSYAGFYRRRARWITGIDYYGEPAKRGVSATDDRKTSEDTRPVAGGTIHPPDTRRSSLAGKRFVFTSAQNNTFVHEEFFKNLLAFCNHRDAQLVVGKFRYNKSGFQNSTKDSDDEDLWYDPKLTPYFITDSVRLGESKTGTVWCGELDILPTAATPLSGLDNYTRTASSIIPHAKVQMKSVPVMKGTPKKFLYTTGAVTQRNYIQRKAGQKAEFHHVFGALYVEFDHSGNEFRRQLIADSGGSFYDLTELFADGQVTGDHRVEAINWGDIHAEAIDPEVANSGWNIEANYAGFTDTMLDTLRPKYQFVHDLTDFRARNHHNIKNPHFLAEQFFNVNSSVQEGMVKAAKVLASMTRSFCQTVVVESNHDQAFKRWLAEADVRQDPENAEYYHTANAELFRHIREGKTFHPFEWAVRRERTLNNVLFLNEDDSFVICGDENGIECGMHGHRGPNGSRGNPANLRSLGRKCNTGHTHSAGIIDGIYTAGISCNDDLGYNKGPSSWSKSHIVTYANGKRAIITMENGRWRA